MKQISIVLFFCALSIFGGAQNHWQPNGGTGLTWVSSVNDLYTDTTTDLLYIAGKISHADTVCSPGIFAWNGSEYLPLGCGIEWNCQGLYQSAGPLVECVTKYGNDIYVGGGFSSASGVPCNNIARWNGTAWDSVGAGVNSGVWGMREINGELYVCGYFNSAGGVPVNGLAKWNGSTWSDVHNFPNYGSNAIDDVIEYNGDLYVCGNFQGANGCNEIVKWDGVNWVNVGGGLYGGNSALENMCIYQNKLYVAGYFIKSENINNPGNFIAAWDGTSWSDPAGGTFDPVFPLNNGQIHDMIVYHNELWVVGAFHYAGGVPGSCVAKWDGTKWCTFDPQNAFDNRPLALEVYHDTLTVGGGFWTINGDSMVDLAKWAGGNYVDTCGQFYLGLDDPASTSDLISVFPNPVTSSATFQIGGVPAARTIIITDATGREVWRRTTDESIIEFSIDGIAAGLYFFNVESDNNVIGRGKFIVQ